MFCMPTAPALPSRVITATRLPVEVRRRAIDQRPRQEVLGPAGRRSGYDLDRAAGKAASLRPTNTRLGPARRRQRRQGAGRWKPTGARNSAVGLPCPAAVTMWPLLDISCGRI